MLKFLCRSTLHVSDCFKAQHCAVLAKCYVFWFWCLKKKSLCTRNDDEDLVILKLLASCFILHNQKV